MKKSILITGCAGFIGSHLAEKLVRNGWKVIGIDNLSTGKEENLKKIRNNPLFKFIKGNVSNIGLIDELVNSCQVVYHLAASVGVKLLTEKPLVSLENNIKSVLAILELANKYKKKVFIASSSEVYGKSNKKSLSEADNMILGVPQVSRWGYGCTKALAEYLALSYFKECGLQVVIGRFFNVCGPRQIGSYGMVIPRFVTSALHAKPIEVFGSGTQTRSFIYINDAVDAMISLMNTPKAAGEVFNIGNPEKVTIKELAKMVKKCTESSSSVVSISYEEAYGLEFEDMQNRVPDISKIKKLVGFKPKYNLENMLEQIVEYWKKNLVLTTNH